MFQYFYEVNELKDNSYELVIYDRHYRKHFSTSISEDKHKLYWDDRIAFVDWIEDTFDDVVKTLV